MSPETSKYLQMNFLKPMCVCVFVCVCGRDKTGAGGLPGEVAL